MLNKNETIDKLKSQLDALENSLKSQLDRAIKNKIPAIAQSCSTLLMQIADAKKSIDSSDSIKEFKETKIENCIERAKTFIENSSLAHSSVKENFSDVKTRNQNIKLSSQEKTSNDDYNTNKFR